VVGAAWAIAACSSPAADASPMRKGPYLQDVTPDAVTVMWQLADPKPARLFVAQDGSDGLPGGERAYDVAAMSVGAIRVTELAPRTHYHYRVEAAGSAWRGEWTTAPTAGDDVALEFVALGDSRDGPDVHRKLMARVAADAPDVIIGNGDIVADGQREADWQEFFVTAGDVLRDVPYYPVLGNHERTRHGPTPSGYLRYFSVPKTSPSVDYYTCSYATTRFVMLDSNATGAELDSETAWLDSELAAARRDPAVKHVVVAMHHAMFSIGSHGGTSALRARWTPLFERNAVTMVISGHDHAYERAQHGGVHYFVSGGGGAPLYERAGSPSAADRAAVVTFESAWHYLRVRLTADRVEVTAIRGDGTAIETTSWSDAPAAREQAAEHDKTTDVKALADAVAAGAPVESLDDDDSLTWLWLLGAALVSLAGGVALMVVRR
jgi:hypothetical protein